MKKGPGLTAPILSTLSFVSLELNLGDVGV